MLHLTVRTAWHDRAWDGAVCNHPAANAFCLALDRVREERDDEHEQSVAGRHWADMDGAEQPPCRQEAAAFMSAREWTRTLDHPYQHLKKAQETHGHLRPTRVGVPPYSTFAVPFAWMTRRDQENIANRLPDRLPEDREPPFKTGWVFGRQRQEALLSIFFDAFTPGESLVFFYTKEGQPVGDSIRRLVVGIGRLTKVGRQVDYDSDDDKPAYPMWDRLVHHSIRPDAADGFILPYHEYLAPTGDPGEDSRRLELLREIAVVPEAAHTRVFSYFSEHATPDVALSTLVRCLDSVRQIRQHGIAQGPWELREDWLNQQIAKTWVDRGAFPGVGSALEALGMRLGTALALDLVSGRHVQPDDNPWPTIDGILRGQIDPPQPAYRADVDTVRATWAKLTDERRDLLRLLSRFALTPAQAIKWFEVSARHAGTVERVADREIIENPYLIAECDLGTIFEPAVSVGVIDRGLLPDPTVAVKCPLPDESRIESASDRRRVRAAAVSVLRGAADGGDSLLSAVEVLTRIGHLDLARPCVVPLDWYPANRDFLDPVVKQFGVEVPTGDETGAMQQLPALQLGSHAETEARLARILLKRAAKALPSVDANWRDLLADAIRHTGADVNLSNARHVDALEEQEQALERISTHRLGVLVGRAGTGKTSVLGALVRCRRIADEGVLLLAPTGKARVRLQRATDHEASTIAQFLYHLERYDGARQRVLFSSSKTYRKEKTVVIDECSMLTMDDLYAVLCALDLGHVERLILVGDPNQLPPIGIGRPFADLVGVLDAPSTEDERQASEVRARLTVEVRTALGGPSDALRLAAWFTNEPQPKDADRVLSGIELDEDFNDLEIVNWKTPEELHMRIGEQLQEQLGLASPTDVAGFDNALGLNEKGWIPFEAPEGAEAFQVLSPVRMHAHGVYDLNRWLQRRFRPRGVWAPSMGDEDIGPKDKVIQLRNQKRDGWSPQGGTQEEYLANGEIGTVARYKPKGQWFDVVFAGRPGLTFGYRASSFGEDGGPLELAYALTVHKAQGSDFGTVFFVLPKTRLLSRELLYTAITRSKQKLVLLIEGDDVSGLYDLTLPTKSETARRNTNLFRSVVREDAEQTPYAEHLIHRLSDGRMVRSKSELAIAIELQRLGMWDRCYYERPIDGVATGGRVRPDFTFIDAAGDPIIWEHLGMLNKESYRRSWEWKLSWFEQNGFTLGENLFTTEDDSAGGLDQTDITRTAQEVEALL